MQPTALDVARFIVQLHDRDAQGGPLTHLRIQKLLYYVQGWHLAAYGEPFFGDRIEAWKNGPVCPSVWRELNDFGDSPIRAGTVKAAENLAAPQKAIVRSIWEAYKKYSGPDLWQMTHTERPWLITRGELPESEPCQREITHHVLADFFTDQMSAKMAPGLTPERIREVEKNISEGRWVSLADLRKKIA